MQPHGDLRPSLFPLPLTSMEKFHWYDSSAAFPNQIYGRFLFAGLVDPNCADQAVAAVMQRHPLLSACVRRSGGQWDWVLDRSRPPTIDWRRPWEAGVAAERIDLTGGLLWRMTARTDGYQSEVWFQMSHVLADGLAGAQMAADWMRFYHQFTDPTARFKDPHQLQSQQLRRRNHLGLFQRSFRKNWWKQPIGCYGAAKFIWRKPLELFEAANTPADWDPQQQPAFMSFWLDESLSSSLQCKCQQLRVSVNSLLLAQLMRTLHIAIEEQAEPTSEWIRILMPISIRSFADRRMPACNRTSVVQIDRRPADFQRPDFIAKLDREIEIIKGWQLHKQLLLALRGMSVLPGLLRRSALSPKCRGTAVMTYLSAPLSRSGLPIENKELHVGNLRLRELDFLGPIRNRIPLNVSLHKYFDRYRFTLHYDPRVVYRWQIERIASLYRDNICSLLRK